MLAPGRKAQSNSAGREKSASARRNGRAASGRGSGASRYEVLERRGEGTLWIVYRVRERPQKSGATDGPSPPLMALKALKQVANRHPRLPAALRENAERFAALSHPNLAVPRDVGIEDNTLYFTTDWLPAPALEARLERGLIAPAPAQRWLANLADALNYLHQNELAHGDVRPRQILFGDKGAPILSDGGIAAAFAEAGLALADVQPEVAHYLAPERSQGEGLSAAADVYALGVCFYRMLCGRVPFDGASALAIAARHRNDAVVPPSHWNERIPPELDELALQLLEKDPARRPTAADIVALFDDDATPATSQARHIASDPALEEAEDKALEDEALEDEAELDATYSVMPPKRRPLDEVVEETMSQDAETKRAEILQRARRKHRWREFNGALGALLFLFLLMGGLGAGVYGAYNYWLGEIPAEVVVPKYIGLSSEQAKAALAKKGLKMKVAREAFDPKKPEGTVLAGDPQEDRKVRSQREVLVTVSAGSAPIKMVDFSKLSLEQARAIILQHGLRLGQSYNQYNQRVPAGYICGQFPEPGDALRRSDPITLIVSRGPQPTDIDAQKGVGMDAASDIIDPSQGSNNASGLSALPQDGTNFTPLEPADNAAPAPDDNASANASAAPTAVASNELKSKRATIRVKVPSDGGRQVVRIVVRDSNGERTVYQRSRSAGSSISRTVRALRPDSDPALVRVYVGDQLIREDSL